MGKIDLNINPYLQATYIEKELKYTLVATNSEVWINENDLTYYVGKALKHLVTAVAEEV